MAAVARGANPVVGLLMVVGSVGAVGLYVRRSLTYTSGEFDRSFSSYNTAISEANRKAAFEGATEDPRTSAFNVLGWRK